MQKTLGRLLLPESKRPFAPSPNHFGDFLFSGNFPGPWLPNLRQKIAIAIAQKSEEDKRATTDVQNGLAFSVDSLLLSLIIFELNSSKPP